MDAQIADRVTEWETVTGPGAVDLQSLARDEFSGAVTAGLAWAFLLNGRVVGLFDGGLEDFEGGDLTAYRAPDPALPLLFSMQETGGETRGKYYSEDTSLREVDRTLSSGKFTGYVELSENVLSGDYYVVYHGGRSMSVAFVGASGRLVTGDEAFDLAADEVGIYSVTAVSVDVTDVPDADARDDFAVGAVDADAPDEAEAVDHGAAGDEDEVDAADESLDGDQASVTFGADASTADGTDDESETDTTVSEPDRYDGLTGGMGIGLNSDTDAEDSTDDAPELSVDTETDDEVDVDADDTDTHVDADDTDTYADADEDVETERVDHEDDVTADAPPTSGDDVSADAADGDETDDSTPLPEHADAETAESSPAIGTTNGKASDEAVDDEVAEHAASGLVGGDDSTEEPLERDDASEPDDSDTSSAIGRDDSGVFQAERQWQQTRRIPSLSPDDSIPRDEASTAPEDADVYAHTDADADVDDDADGTADDGAPDSDEQPTTATDDPESESPATTAVTAGETAVDVSDLERRIEQVRTERDELASMVETLETDLESVTRERDRLRARVADLESELARLRETAAAQQDTDGTHLSPAAAREGTNLFVRYRSKGKPTLKKAQAGEAKQNEVVENLRLEYHTTFDGEEATVDGDPYESFLYGTTEWQFTKWVVEELLYEIGRSGHRVDLAPMFDRIPEIDRVEFDGTVPVTIDDGESQSHESRTFDLVFWDSMGDPLFVVDVDTSRNATTQGMVGSLIEGARAVGESKDTLGGAFYVTTSFFEPGALDAVGEATKSGLLSRSSKKSFVKLSRKQGYHLCLVEARDGEFHLAVPEL